MNTGADDDSRSTPTLALCTSSACASSVPAIASKPANTSRANPIIQFPPSLLFILKHWLRISATVARASRRPLPMGEVTPSIPSEFQFIAQTLQLFRHALVPRDKSPL